MTKKQRYISIMICGVMIFALVIASAVFSDLKKQTRFISHIDGVEAEQNSDAVQYLNEDYTAEEGFSSHLPLVVVDTYGKTIERNSKWDTEAGYMVPLEGIEPYVKATIAIYNNGTTMNFLTDKPAIFSHAEIKRRGNNSMGFEKGQYRIKLLTESGQENKISILGMGLEDEWILGSSIRDKSLLRNYVAYTIASEIMPYVPDAQYCEVFFKNSDDYEYQGVYLLTESIMQGEDNVDISSENTGSGTHSYIVRRDRYDPENIMLNTYATQNELSYGYLGVIYPKNEKLTDDILQYIETDISTIEQILYSDDPYVFLTYEKYIDIDSFVDYFLMNEFFTNYDAGNNSTYMYKELGGKLCIGPVWDFDMALDNYNQSALNSDAFAFHFASWYDRLILSTDFLEKLESRYSALRRSALSEKNTNQTIMAAARYLEPARERDWMRWRDLYTGEKYALNNVITEDGDEIIRQTDTYDQEIIKLQHLLHTHGKMMESEMGELAEPERMMASSDNGRKNSIYAILFILVFFSTVLLVNRQ